jgi:hypothetical protein
MNKALACSAYATDGLSESGGLRPSIPWPRGTFAAASRCRKHASSRQLEISDCRDISNGGPRSVVAADAFICIHLRPKRETAG